MTHHDFFETMMWSTAISVTTFFLVFYLQHIWDIECKHYTNPPTISLIIQYVYYKRRWLILIPSSEWRDDKSSTDRFPSSFNFNISNLNEINMLIYYFKKWQWLQSFMISCTYLILFWNYYYVIKCGITLICRTKVTLEWDWENYQDYSSNKSRVTPFEIDLMLYDKTGVIRQRIS